MSILKAPLLRYHGGKWRMADWIAGQLPAPLEQVQQTWAKRWQEVV